MMNLKLLAAYYRLISSFLWNSLCWLVVPVLFSVPGDIHLECFAPGPTGGASCCSYKGHILWAVCLEPLIYLTHKLVTYGHCYHKFLVTSFLVPSTLWNYLDCYKQSFFTLSLVFSNMFTQWGLNKHPLETVELSFSLSYCTCAYVLPKKDSWKESSCPKADTCTSDFVSSFQEHKRVEVIACL